MTQTLTAADRAPTGNRSGSSRKLLTRKAVQTAPAALLAAEGLEADFPLGEDSRYSGSTEGQDLRESSPSTCNGGTASAEAAPGEGATELLPAGEPQAPPAAWSSEDEAALQVLLARRKAAGYQRRGRDVGSQLLRPSGTKPNADTIVDTIVALVAERGTVARSELIELMQATAFPHPKAQPSDKGWCQGYVAGAIRNGFLVAEPASATPAEEG